MVDETTQGEAGEAQEQEAQTPEAPVEAVDHKRIQKRLERELKKSHGVTKELTGKVDQMLSAIEMLSNRVSGMEGASKASVEYDAYGNPVQKQGQQLDPNRLVDAVVAKLRGQAEPRQDPQDQPISQELQQAQVDYLTDIIPDFPELNDPKSDLYRRAAEIYAERGWNRGKAPETGMLDAARMAIGELGAQPLSKRNRQVNNPKPASQEKKQNQLESSAAGGTVGSDKDDAIRAFFNHPGSFRGTNTSLRDLIMKTQEEVRSRSKR